MVFIDHGMTLGRADFTLTRSETFPSEGDRTVKGLTDDWQTWNFSYNLTHDDEKSGDDMEILVIPDYWWIFTHKTRMTFMTDRTIQFSFSINFSPQFQLSFRHALTLN